MARIIKADTMQGSEGQRAAALRLADFASEARSIVLDARKEAARIVADARARAEAAQREAAERGFAEGFERGAAEGRQAGRDEAFHQAVQARARESAEAAQLAERILDEMQSERSGAWDHLPAHLVQFALDLATKIVGEVAVRDIHAACVNLAKAMDLAKGAGEMTILANPAQVELLKRYYANLAGALNGGDQARLVGDERIGPGGVKLLTSHGEIDATIRTQLANVAEALVGGQDAADRGGGHAACEDLADEPGDDRRLAAAGAGCVAAGAAAEADDGEEAAYVPEMADMPDAPATERSQTDPIHRPEAGAADAAPPDGPKVRPVARHVTPWVQAKATQWPHSQVSDGSL